MSDTPIDVVGAGMAGLLAAGMLRKQCNGVWERSPSLPNNHSAVLRFRSTAVADALSISFKEVTAIKSVMPWRNPIADAMAYSLKTNGTASMRSVLTADSTPQKRYIAPSNMIEQMANAVEAPIQFGKAYSNWPGIYPSGERVPIISTIPMPALMHIMYYPDREDIEFNNRGGMNIIAEVIGGDAYFSLYVPDPSYSYSRISMEGSRLIIECQDRLFIPTKDALEEYVKQAIALVGIPFSMIGRWEVKEQKYAKILPIPEDERRRFIIWASDRGVYSLGRYATWRPGLLLDDVVNDVRVIQRLIRNRGEAYPHKLKG